MTIQHVDADGLTLIVLPAPPVWFPGSAEEGLDARLELTHLDGGSSQDGESPHSGAPQAGRGADGGVAVRDARYPAGPVLLFSVPEWNTLLGREPDLVDVR
jgi:hypothetical protein